MNVEINEAVRFVTRAVTQKDEPTAKAAHKKVAEITQKLLSLVSIPEALTPSDLDKLIFLDAQLPAIWGKYQGKIQHNLRKLCDRKAIWVANALLPPRPLNIPLHALDLLKEHSTYIQKQQNEITLPENISPTTLHFLIEHLSSGSPPKLSPEELTDFYLAADSLGIQSLQSQADTAIQNWLSQQSHQAILKLLCKLAIGKIEGQVLASRALEAFIEQECRYAHNREYLQQPSPEAYIRKVFCPNHNLTWEQFRQRAQKTQFLKYLDALDPNDGTDEDDYDLYQEIALRVRNKRKFGEIVDLLNFEITPENRTSCLYLLNRESRKAKKLLDSPSTNAKQRAIIQPLEARFDDLRDNPAGWIQKIEQALQQAKTEEDFKQIVEEVTSFQKRFKTEALHQFDAFCYATLFTAYYELNNEEQAKAQIIYLNVDDVTRKDIFVIYQYEMGIFTEKHIHPNLKRLYMRDFSKENMGSEIASVLIKIVQGRLVPITRRVQFGKQDWLIQLDNPIPSLIDICEEQPQLVLVRIILAHHYWKQNQDEFALEYCWQALKLQNNPEILFLKACILLKRKAYNLVEKDCVELLRQNFSYRNLDLYVRCLDEGQGFQAAWEYLEKNASQDAQWAKIQLLLKHDRVQEAEEHLGKQNNPEDPQYMLLQASIYAKREQYSQLMETTQKALEKDPNNLALLLLSLQACLDPTIVDLAALQKLESYKERLKQHSDWQEPKNFGPFIILKAIKGILTNQPTALENAYEKMLQMQQRGDHGIHWDRVLHAALKHLGHYGRMDEAYLAAHDTSTYGKYLFFFNRFEEALQHADTPLTLAICYDHLERYKEASKQYENSSTANGRIRAAELKLRRRGLKASFDTRSFSDYGFYPDMCKLFKEGRYAELVQFADQCFDASLVNNQGLFIAFYMAKGYYELGNQQKAMEIVERINSNYNAKIYGEVLRQEVNEWAKQNLNVAQKRAKK